LSTKLTEVIDTLYLSGTVNLCSNLITSVNEGFAFTHSVQVLFKVLSYHIIKVDATEISNFKLPVPTKGYTWNETEAPVSVLNTPIVQK